ncbi:pyruvate kinase, partial [Halomonas sp. 18H]
GAERERVAQASGHRIHEGFSRIDETIALSAMYAANHLAGVAAIVCMTSTGYTPLIASRIRSGLPIVGLAHNPVAQRRMALYRGVVSLPFDTSQMTADELNDRAMDVLVRHSIAEPGDHVILTRGDHMNAHGGTNTLKILDVGTHHGQH